MEEGEAKTGTVIEHKPMPHPGSVIIPERLTHV